MPSVRMAKRITAPNLNDLSQRLVLLAAIRFCGLVRYPLPCGLLTFSRAYTFVAVIASKKASGKGVPVAAVEAARTV